MPSADDVRRVLIQSPSDALCDICLAVTCGTTLEDVQHLRKVVIDRGDIAEEAMCTSCRRAVPAVAYRPKCLHCSLPLGGRDLVIEGDAFHVHCLRRLATDQTIQTTRVLSHRSRELIEDSRRRMREGRDWPDLLAD
jgi:hypothetical protein